MAGLSASSTQGHCAPMQLTDVVAELFAELPNSAEHQTHAE